METTQNIKQVYLHAMQLLAGRGQDPSKQEFREATRHLRHASRTLPPAQNTLATLLALGCEGKSDDAGATHMFLKAATSGFPPAIRSLAICLLQSAPTQSMGAGLLRRAASGGDWVAAFLILRQAERGIYYGTKAELEQLAALLSPAVPFRDSLIAKVATLEPNISLITASPFSLALCEHAVTNWLEPHVAESPNPLHASPYVASYHNVLSPLLCDYLIATTTALMQPSKVVDATEAGAVSAQYRTSDGAVLLPAHMDIIHTGIVRQLAKIADIEPHQGEFLSLLRYKPGQEYRPHHDFLKEDTKDFSKVIACGQRRRTLLTYLNEGYAGGATAFPKLDITYKGKTGDALRFDNIDAHGHPYDDSLHAGVPVKSGEKWLATLWCRERTFWPWA